MIDINKLTMGEVSRIEKLSGQPITVMGDDEKPKGDVMAALYFVFKRRELMASGQPMASFTWEDAQNATFEEVDDFLDLSGEKAQREADAAAQREASMDAHPSTAQTVAAGIQHYEEPLPGVVPPSRPTPPYALDGGFPHPYQVPTTPATEQRPTDAV